MTEFFDRWKSVTPEAARSGADGALPAQIAQAQRAAPALGRHPGRVSMPPASLARRTGAPAGHAQGRAAGAPAGQPRRRARCLRRLLHRALERPAMRARVYASPGPIYEPEGTAVDYWRTARALYAAGFRAGDLVHNAFSYHMTPGAFIMESRRAGGWLHGVSRRHRPDRAAAAGHRRAEAQAYVGTPSFLRILCEKAQEAAPTCAADHQGPGPARPFRRRCATGSPSVA
jgi:phenylacetate-CoA ligase